MKLLIAEPEFFKVLDCSTGHINEQDDSLLGYDYSLNKHDEHGNRLPQPLCVQELDGGGRLVSTWAGDWDIAPSEMNAVMLRFGYTQELFNLLDYARATGCRYLKLDRDGPLYNDVPQFEW